MEYSQIIPLRALKPLEVSQKDFRHYTYMVRLVSELNKRELPSEVVRFINDNIELINHAIDNKFELKKQIKTSKNAILKLLEKQLKLVTKNHYRNLWMVLGMTVFGVPIGIAYGNMIDNMAFLGIGIGIGMSIGLALGSSMDKKAAVEGRQLDIEANF
ncbi:hypothetical protein J1N10_15360 [Carboxylicivirga sp. A043]|uniref:hypothetical protein n=1 Tax=Carboxylicivirga litoralis TaxID=2816963 RepID=UPI0021CB7045|nr:hypothetical protein [Carboxylicivirga sp. A043]MCU4157353.1 hypothetical protein [Carboxylicivirga sp. A043]